MNLSQQQTGSPSAPIAPEVGANNESLTSPPHQLHPSLSSLHLAFVVNDTTTATDDGEAETEQPAITSGTNQPAASTDPLRLHPLLAGSGESGSGGGCSNVSMTSSCTRGRGLSTGDEGRSAGGGGGGGPPTTTASSNRETPLPPASLPGQHQVSYGPAYQPIPQPSDKYRVYR